jgi:hypothetical protein
MGDPRARDIAPPDGYPYEVGCCDPPCDNCPCPHHEACQSAPTPCTNCVDGVVLFNGERPPFIASCPLCPAGARVRESDAA